MIHRMSRLTLPASILLAAAAFSNVVAAEPATGRVAGNGSATIEEYPRTLRVKLTIQAKDSDAAKALEKLDALCASASSKLEQLGARHADTKWGDPSPSQGVSQQQQQMRAMMMQRMRGNPRVAERLKTPEVIVVGRDLTAEWPLEFDDPAQLVKATLALTKRIRDARLAGEKEAETLSPEEQELLEEAAQMSYTGEEEADPSEPKFSYVSKISDEIYSKALAEAFTRSKREAEMLAQAAGARLGPLHQISAMASSSEDMSEMDYYAMAAYRQVMQNQGPTSGQTREAVSTMPGKVRYMVQVTASFYLE